MNKGVNGEVERKCEDHSVEKICNGIKKKEDSRKKKKERQL